MWDIRFSTVDSRTIILFNKISYNKSLCITKAVLIANMAQPIILVAYFLYNSQVTVITIVAKWDRFTRRHTRLRVLLATAGA